jgi:hypothetical protein
MLDRWQGQWRCIAGQAVASAADLKSQRAEPAAAVDHRNDEAAAPARPAMDHMQILHRQKWADAHPIGDLKRNQAISKALLPLELRRNQCAASQCLGDALRILEGLDA